MVLEYLKVFLSPQMTVLAVVVLVALKFHKQLAALIDRVARIKLRGVGEFETPQRARQDISDDPKPPTTAGADSVELPAMLELNADQIEALREFFQAERSRAALWEYRYLNMYLVQSTQRVLDWLITLNQRTTVSFADSVWAPLIPQIEERRAILTALQTHSLVNVTGELIEVTPKGKEYAQWRGPLPTLPLMPNAGSPETGD